LDDLEARHDEQVRTIRDLRSLLEKTKKQLEESLLAQASFTVVTKQVQAANKSLEEKIKRLATTVNDLLNSMNVPISRTKLALVTEGSFMIIFCVSLESPQRTKKQHLRHPVGVMIVILSVHPGRFWVRMPRSLRMVRLLYFAACLKMRRNSRR
jgi:hypothetical protein